MKTLYAAYGSNMSIEQMNRRCPGAKLVGPSTLKDHTLTFRRDKGVANVEPKYGEDVPLVMWRLTTSCEKALDRYEGFPRVYTKKYLSVEVSGEEQLALFYIMNDHLWEILGIPSLQYYQTIRAGYIDNHLDVTYLDKQVEKAREEYKKAQSV